MSRGSKHTLYMRLWRRRHRAKARRYEKVSAAPVYRELACKAWR